jgi:hypothetical protein
MGRPKKHTLRKLLYLDPEMGEAIDSFRFSLRYKTEQEAIRELLRLGLVAWTSPQGTRGVDPSELPAASKKRPSHRAPQLAAKAAKKHVGANPRFQAAEITYVSEEDVEREQAKEAERLAERIARR